MIPAILLELSVLCIFAISQHHVNAAMQRRKASEHLRMSSIHDF